MGDLASNLSCDPETGPVSAHLKWFDARKGFGFVIPENQSIEAFLHTTVLREAGIDGLGEGACLLCIIEQSTKGAKVKKILTVLDIGRDPKPIVSSNTHEKFSDFSDMTGIVKWYKPEKGFGFVRADDGGADILLHSKLLKRYGFEAIEPRTPLLLKVRSTSKGRLAVDFQIID